MVNKYLFLAYGIVWLIFMAYAWSLARRQARMDRDLDELKAKLERQSPSASQET